MLDSTSPLNVTLYISGQSLEYRLSYSASGNNMRWVTEFPSSFMAFAPTNWFVFEGSMFALFSSGSGEPWLAKHEVGFCSVDETYYEENIPDFDVWS